MQYPSEECFHVSHTLNKNTKSLDLFYTSMCQTIMYTLFLKCDIYFISHQSLTAPGQILMEYECAISAEGGLCLREISG